MLIDGTGSIENFRRKMGGTRIEETLEYISNTFLSPSHMGSAHHVYSFCCCHHKQLPEVYPDTPQLSYTYSFLPFSPKIALVKESGLLVRTLSTYTQVQN